MIDVEHRVPTKQEACQSQPNVRSETGACRHCTATGPEHSDCTCAKCDRAVLGGCPVWYPTTAEDKRDPLADSLGIAPETLASGCGCDRPRWEIRPCGHCACGSVCDDCPANKLWRWEQESWCGCMQPGRDGVLACGHCACGFGCFEVVRGNSLAPKQKAPCAA